MKAHTHHYDIQEQYTFSASAKKKLITLLVGGLILSIIGIILMVMGGSGHHDHASLLSTGALAGAGGEGGGHGHAPFHWTHRLYANLWVNNMFFTGLAIIGVFFVAIQYVASAGWSAGLKRVPEAFGSFLPVAFGLTLVVFLIANHDLFHWTHDYLYDKSSPEYDPIIDGKKAFLNMPFYLARMVVFFLGWILMYQLIRKESIKEDMNGGLAHYRKMVKYSAIFIVFFAVSSSVSAWDWIMSIDTHWFSTMFGWYVFASWFVSGLAAITLMIVFLKDAGYLSIIREDHLHDMGKFVFAFSIFWTYIWFSQFLLIYYANIPEETIYFFERLNSDFYGKFIFLNLFLNFIFPFLVLMTRESKRKMTFLKIVCTVVLVGHWFDFFLMIMPGTVKDNGGFGFLEIGLIMVYMSAFLFVVLNALSKAPLIAKNHPMLNEALNHHI